MKCFNGLVCLTSALFLQSVSAEEVLSVRQTSVSEVKVTVKTKYHCNQPVLTLSPIGVGQFKFGPHFYRLEIVPINKRLCHGEGEVDITTSIPSKVRRGDVLMLVAIDESVAVLKYDDGILTKDF